MTIDEMTKRQINVLIAIVKKMFVKDFRFEIDIIIMDSACYARNAHFWD